MGSHEVAGVLSQKYLYVLMVTINSGCFKINISQNVAKFMPSLTSQSCGDSQPAICLFRQDEAMCRPPVHSWMSDRLKKAVDLYFWLWYTDELLVYCCVSQVVVKSEQ